VKILLDENLPHQLRAYFQRHEAFTTAYLGWGGIKNGALIQAAEEAGFDVLISGDLSLEYQQNISGRRIAVVSLSSHNWRVIRPHAARIAAAVDEVKPGAFTPVACGRFSRKPTGPTLD
jgi:hypothetical protein